MDQKQDGNLAVAISQIPKSVQQKITAYKQSIGLTSFERDRVRLECRRLEEKLGIERIAPRQYIFLRKIADHLMINEPINLSKLAEESGYAKWRAKRAKVAILNDIDDKLFSEIVGFSTKDIEFELLKTMRQDSDLTAKLRSLELAAKIKGMMDDRNQTAIQINVKGFDIAD